MKLKNYTKFRQNNYIEYLRGPIKLKNNDKNRIIQINAFLFLERKQEREMEVQKDQIQSSNPIIYLLSNTSFYPF